MSAHRKPPLLGIPRNVNVSDIAARQGFVQKTEAEKKNARELLKKQGQMEQVGRSLNIPPPGHDHDSTIQQGAEVDDSWASLPVAAINFYERNPRKANNEIYEELRESIRINGILQPLSVTKRPNASQYILYAGGNTRLQAIKELWEETRNPKFREARVIIKAWRGDAAVLLAHMAENTQRNDMTFWDRANGILDIKTQMDAEREKPLSYREFEAELKKSGITLNIQSLSVFRFAIEKLPEVGPWLSGLSVRGIQPRLNLMLRLANHHNLEEPEFYSDIVSSASRALASRIHGGETGFSAEVMIEGCATLMSGRLGVELRDLGKMLTALERFPDIGLEELRRICKPAPQVNSSVPVACTPQAGDAPPKEHKSESPPRPASTSVAVEMPLPAPVEQGSPLQPEHRAQAGRDASQTADENKLHTLATRLLAASGIGDCYQVMPSMPNGYCMGFPKDGPLDLKEQAQNRQAAWWVLAVASGQFDKKTCRAGLPEGDEWLALILEESNDDSLDGLELAIQHNIGGQGEFLSIPWLLNSRSEVAGLCLKVLAAVRAEPEEVGVSA